MTSDFEEPVANEPMYRVIDVAGHTPVSLDDLIGATTVTVANDGNEYRLIGSGVKLHDRVLFHQKEAGSALETGPVWTITIDAAAGLTARPPRPN